MLKANTQDFQMVIIDQTEAKFNASDVFFVDQAQEHVEDYKIGDSAFWKESGNDWKRQLEQYDNVETHLKAKDMKDWSKIADRRLAKDKQKEMEEEREKDRFPTNQIGLAPKEMQEMYRREMEKRFKKESHLKQAKGRVEKIFYFKPGKATFMAP